ncbi:ABC transporter permease [Roseimaritima sediminicola]|uniref:ABC transporter permease n=1 Tax=Roseimaritima sediminicola TaxID=2662066 RepID=UPI001EEE5E2A|nr:ABC transporter permease [Roseimaritima sediminicola]
MRFISKLVISQMRMHPGRWLTTTLAIVASTCALVWVVSGYDALVSQFDENADKYLGRYDLLILPTSGGLLASPSASIDAALIQRLQADAGVREVNAIGNYRATVSRADARSEETESTLGLLIGDRPPVNGAPPVGPTLVSTPAAEPPYEMIQGHWLGSRDDGESTVVTEQVAEALKIAVGDAVLVTTFGNQVRLRVVGIVEQATEAPALRGSDGRGPSQQRKPRAKPSVPGPGNKSSLSVSSSSHEPADRRAGGQPIGLPRGAASGVAIDAVYVRPETASNINGYAAEPQILQVAMRDNVSVEQFRELWQQPLASTEPPLQIVDFAAVRGGMQQSRSVGSQQAQALAATGMASLAAVFIIFSTLSMGVGERIRELAMLRAVAMTRTQIAVMVAVESLALAVLGWVGGLVAGWAMVLVGSRVLPGLFSGTAVLGWACLALTGVTVLVGALGAAILPALRAIRIRPLDAMSTYHPAPPFRSWASWGVVGLVLSAATPVLVFGLPMSDEWRRWAYTYVSYPSLLLGMILMAPAVVVLCERCFAPLLSRVWRLDQRMMRTQLSTNLWRSVGATLALSIGLGLYASTQTWGYSMLIPFTPGDWLPDGLVAIHPAGLDAEEESLLGEVEGVRSDQVLPLAIEQAKFAWGEEGPPPRLKFGDNAVLCGLDPQAAFGGERAMLPVEFVSGDRQSAIGALAAGDGACIVSEDFVMATGLEVGDPVHFTPPADDGDRITYRIAAVVRLPGWQWITKFSGVRRHYVRTGTLLFANRAEVQADFHLQRTEFFWVNLQPGADIAAVEARCQTLAEQHGEGSFAAAGVGRVEAYRPFARLTATETVRRAIRMHADGIIWRMSYLPLVTLTIMSLAMVNTVIASVRSRTWEFGVMRAIGVNRSQLVRLVFAESVLLGLAACVLSLIFGLVAGWCGVGMARFGGWFAGPPTFHIPWAQLSIGFSFTLLLCLLAGLWPAFKTGRAEPLKLLRSGRATQ